MLVYRDYYPFGWELPERTYTLGDGYRYGYQGAYAEKDEETGWSAFELRSYDGRVGRWMSIDPMEEFWSPYVGMGNRPHMVTDPTGGHTETWYVNNANPQERVWVNDGLEGTIYVNSTDFETAVYFASIAQGGDYPFVDFSSLDADMTNTQAYHAFYWSVKSYDGFSFGNVADYFFGGPNDGILEISPGPVSSAGGNVAAFGSVRLFGIAKKAKWVKAIQGVEGPGLRNHFAKHGSQVGATSARAYDISARTTIQNGRRFKYRDRSSGDFRIGYFDSQTGFFTATSQSRRTPTIFTHFPETWENLRKLPGFTTY
ncbi:MAG: RHS repeat-associated core domain-containing protein [Cyanobacteria bacterium J06649_11]